MGITSLSPLEAVLIALSGIVIVFLMLICLAGIITVVSKIVAALTNGAKDNAPEQAAPSVAAPAMAGQAVAPDAVYGGNVRLIDVDEKTAACIMAIVSDGTGIPLSELVFHTIRAL